MRIIFLSDYNQFKAQVTEMRAFDDSCTSRGINAVDCARYLYLYFIIFFASGGICGI